VTERTATTLLLALGNDILGDDGVGLAAARILKTEFGDGIEIEETSEAGLALMELMEGYERALLLDSIVTGQCPVGTVLEFAPGDFQRVIAPSPHYAGMPEILDLARRLDIPFPAEIRVLALEVEDPFHLRESFTASVQEAFPAFVDRARRILNQWRQDVSCTNTP
jgi:hydrogenase maturation protease